LKKLTGVDSSGAEGDRAERGERSSPAQIERLLRRSGLKPVWWSNGPGDRYDAHAHAYDKVLCCAVGSITFVLHPSGERIDLLAGDRLELPAGQEHSALVGRRGVTCAEGWRKV
jgi:quercetin dioxygenase-like cupin family protein